MVGDAPWEPDTEWMCKRDAAKAACRASGSHDPQFGAIVVSDGVHTIRGFRCNACGYYGSD